MVAIKKEDKATVTLKTDENLMVSANIMHLTFMALHAEMAIDRS